MNPAYFLVGALLIIAIGLAGWLFYLNKKESEDDILEGSMVINLMAPLGDNRAFGIEKSAKIGDGGRWLCKYFPTDVHPDNVAKAKIVKVVVGKGKRHVIPVNDWSAEKSIVIYLPPTTQELPDYLKKIFGDKMNFIEVINAVETELKAVRIGSKRKSQIAENLGDGELSQEALQQASEINKDLKKFYGEDRKKTSSSSSSSSK